MLREKLLKISMKEQQKNNRLVWVRRTFGSGRFPYKFLKKIFFGIALCISIFSQQMSAQENDYLSAFSDPSLIWGNGVERVIEEAYRNCFITRIIGDKIMNIRMPFGENNERGGLLNRFGHNILEGGKGTPGSLWPAIDAMLASPKFMEYSKALSNGKEQVIIFDIATRTWKSSRDFFDIARMKAGSYRGLHHRPYVLVSGQGIEEIDVYNYLYCIGLVGMDCSGFVYYVLSYIARQGGLDLGRILGPSLGVPREDNFSWYVGTSFFSSENYNIIRINDEIANLKPADIMLFMGPEGRITHSAIIQSIDWKKGVIRYLQCTDEAPQNERGVHESFVHFNPERPRISLSDYSLNWTQRRLAAFPGERGSVFPNDAVRYRAHAIFGGGRVVRLRPLIPVIERLNRRQ